MSIVQQVVDAAPLDLLRKVPGASCMSIKQWFGDAANCDNIRRAARARLDALADEASYDTLAAQREAFSP